MNAGILVEVDSSIKAVIVEIDNQEYGKYIIEELDDEHLLVHKNVLEQLKERIQAVCRICTNLNIHEKADEVKEAETRKGCPEL